MTTLVEFVEDMYRYHGKRLDSRVKKIYVHGLTGFDVDELEAAFQAYIRESSEQAPPSINYFVQARNRRIRAEQEAEALAADREAGVIDKQSAKYFRQRLSALVAMHLTGIANPSPDPHLPETIYVILRDTVGRFKAAHPGGLAGRRSYEIETITREYIDYATWRFDDEAAENFAMTGESTF